MAVTTTASRFRDIADDELKNKLFQWMLGDLGMSRTQLLVDYKGQLGSWRGWFTRWSWRRFRRVSLLEGIESIWLSSIVRDSNSWYIIRYKIITKQNETHALVCGFEDKPAPRGFYKRYEPRWDESWASNTNGNTVIFRGDEHLISGSVIDINNRFELVNE
jgi:hypothetical protein